MRSFLSVVILFWMGRAVALDVSLKSEVVASEASEMLLTELFSPGVLPVHFYEKIRNQTLPLDFSRKNSLRLSRQKISKNLRQAVLDYNESREYKDNKIRLKIPNWVKVYAPVHSMSVAAIKQRILKAIKPMCSKCEFEVTLNVPKIPKQDLGKSWRLLNPKKRWKGTVSLFLEGENFEYPLSVKIRWFQKILTAKKNILVGQKITSANLSQKNHDVTFLVANFMTRRADAMGMKAVKNIRRGQPMEPSALGRPDVVQFGSILSASISNKNFSVHVPATAKSSGAVGDIIPVELTTNKKRVMARVINHQKVEVQ